MEKKLYLIGGHQFKLKEYGDLTGFDEEAIDRVMGNSNNEIIVTGYEIFPIILSSPEPEIDPASFDWRHLTNNQIAEILVDFAIQKKSSRDSAAEYMTNLINRAKDQNFQN